MGFAAMRTVLRSYEPVFGGMVAALAAVVLCLVMLIRSHPGSHTGTAMPLWYSGTALSWGLLQVIGYRSAKRKNIQLAAPVFDTALGCVLLGLISVLVTVCLYEFARDTWYFIATGAVASLLLAAGAILGIRRGTWR